MPVKLFLTGPPGSGKSSIARSIQEYFENRRREIVHFNDYHILDRMFRIENMAGFKPASPEGFDVLDLDLFDKALKRLEQEINGHILSIQAGSNKMIIIEFARNNYEHAFSLFDKVFFQEAYFIHLDAGLEICRQRISERTSNPAHEDDYPVSDYIFENYYLGDDGKFIPKMITATYAIDERKAIVVDNNGTLDAAIEQITPFIDDIISAEVAHIKKV